MEVDEERRAWEEDEDGDAEQGGGARLAWERDYERTWEVVQEDATGALDTHSFLHSQQRLRRAEREQMGGGGGGGRAVRRGMQRHLVLVVDLSQAMDDAHDMKPSRLAVTLKIVEAFIREYFEQNPIAQLGIVIMRDGAAEKLSELGGNPARHIAVLKDRASTGGSASLQNAIEEAYSSLCHVPKYGSREIVVLFAGLATCDPTDIKSTISKLKKDNIRCSIVGLSAEIHICRVLTESTDGTYGVALHEGHYRQLVFAHVSPPPAQPQQVAASLIRMGFPTRKRDPFPSFCSCHKSLRREGYVCPQCGARCCELPMECPVCGLTLVSSSHLARSYHHLFPLPLFQAVPLGPLEEVACFGCRRRVKGTTAAGGGGGSGGAEVYACPRCAQRFCYECDVFAHDLLHTCAGCELRP